MKKDEDESGHSNLDGGTSLHMIRLSFQKKTIL
jgi:hypothetical protein